MLRHGGLGARWRAVANPPQRFFIDLEIVKLLNLIGIVGSRFFIDL